MLIRLLISLLCSVNIGAIGPAQAAEQTQTFATPAIKTVRLDWCKHWARDCGGPAATLFCNQQGFQRAKSWSIDANVGARGIATLVFGDGRICRAPNCSGFRTIVCAKDVAAKPAPKATDDKAAGQIMVPGGKKTPPSKPIKGPAMQTITDGPNAATFRFPHIKGVRLDWCRHWGRQCGGDAADLFCREMGFDRASKLRRDDTAGRKGIQTLVFGDGRLCEGSTCRAFALITCTRQAVKPDVAAPGEPDQRPSTSPAKPADQKPVPSAPVKPVDDKPASGALKPAAPTPVITYRPFKLLTPQVATFKWVGVLNTVGHYPAGASLFMCASGDCSIATSTDFEVNPSDQFQSVQLNFSVIKVPYAGGALWQVSYLPFPPFANAAKSDLDPKGLVASERVSTKQGWFAFDLRELAGKLPPGAGQKAIFHVRVLPVSTVGTGNIVGQPSNVMRIFYGTKLPPQQPYEIYSMEEIPESAPKVRLVRLEFEPFKSVERWPPGCKTWEEKYGKKSRESGVVKVIKEIGNAIKSAWNWTSKAYQWAKDRVIDIARALTFKLIPEDVFTYALNAALASVGIPPDIPNLDQLMKEGVDGLAKEFAKTAVHQIPAADLASNVGNLAADISINTARGMAEDELRRRLEREIESRSREAILKASDEIKKQVQKEGKGKLCTPTHFQPVFLVTVQNTGNRDYRGVTVSVGAGPVYQGRIWNADFRKGETMTLVTVGTPLLPNGPYSHPLLYPAQREEEDVERWWSEILYKKPATISVEIAGAEYCLGGQPGGRFCERRMVTAHKAPPRMVTEPYQFAP